MTKTITQTDLILYAFNESGLQESDRVQRGIDGDPVVQSEFGEVLESIELLDKSLEEPSQQSVEKILAFALKGKA